jgi:hypothetical protein
MLWICHKSRGRASSLDSCPGGEDEEERREMLTIEWVRDRGGNMPLCVVETECCAGKPLADAIAHAKALFASTRERLPLGPPDGFRIVDSSGRELALWLAGRAFVIWPRSEPITAARTVA